MAHTKFDNALDYHASGRPGKIEVVPTKPTQTKRDLSMAYSPGVAEPCEEIAKHPEDVYKYTAKGNLVAVISNGTAVLGLGNLGASASKPVMEGKGVLFKIFADIDVFDIEIDTENVEDFIRTVKLLEPTFGGVNLEDIKAPESFEIEERLKEELNIPIMHDDQHGTAIITGAALLNALKLVEKNIEDIRLVINGAGASAIACGKLFVGLGVKKENLIMLDSKGVIKKDRENLSPQKSYFAADTELSTLEDAMNGADVFVGLSKGNIVSGDMIRSMADHPIVFALANPDPEIAYEEAIASRDDIIMATGRSDHPNQVNNVLGFPFIFRGALDVRSTAINEEMKLAAVKAIAELATEPVPDSVSLAYNVANLSFGKDYIIPKPLDPRLITKVAPAVARAAMESGVAKQEITDWDGYEIELRKRLGLDNKFLRRLTLQAKQHPKKVVFAEGDHDKVLMAAAICVDEQTITPILLGNEEKIKSKIEALQLEFPEDTQIIDPLVDHQHVSEFAEILFEKRQRRGLTLNESKRAIRHRNYFGIMMVETGMADAFIGGNSRNYPATIRPAIEVIGKRDDIRRVAGMYALMSKKGPLFFSDTTVNLTPTWEELVDITLLTHQKVRDLGVEPRIAMVSYSNFGSAKGVDVNNIQKAVAFLHEHYPNIVVDGDMQANMALDPELRNELFPFSKLGNDSANTFIFPNLASGNVAYKFIQSLGIAEAIGPILMGLNKSVHVLQQGSTVREIVNMINVAVVDAEVKS
jgi:malate dehydrogenase (oxaloacetate-decarboxylating)(NADP+)